MYIYSQIDADNTYDYDNDTTTTDDKYIALAWIEDGKCEQVAVLDALSLEYLGYLDADDVNDVSSYDEVDDYDY
jgi:hypothetical protein